MEALIRACGARRLHRGPRIQSLWSGYGELFRARLEGASPEEVVIKHVHPPSARHHPRGWSSDRGHARKLRSYEVEIAWYRDWAPKCGPAARVPRCLTTRSEDGQWWLVLEDLDALGFTGRPRDLDPQQTQSCLRWLAHFHAVFMTERPEHPPAGLWPVGTYWHLETRPDELAATRDPRLVRAAPRWDEQLRQARFQTIVHGDAKVANFCFEEGGDRVAAVDFQYVGGGCGMKDVAYFLSSLSDVEACEAEAAGHLDRYFDYLRTALEPRPEIDTEAVEQEWRALYPVAWADFFRFLAGWAPDHWKVNRYSRRMTDRALAELGL